MGVGETITVINRSGKVVSSSKHLVNVFKEAKSAYRERKAEIHAERHAALQDKQLRAGVKALQLDTTNDDTRSHASSRRSKTSKSPHRSKSHRRPPMERGYTDSYYANDAPPPVPTKPHRYEQDLAGEARDTHIRELTRRQTDLPLTTTSLRQRDERARSEAHIDMDLAYGDLPPPLPSPTYADAELREKATKLTTLLDEFNCLQHSVTAMIENLQKNPEAMAAVALTLAEISSIVGKMGPGMLPLLKGSFPAVVALLASPQFMIAAGVGVGVTIVALGGYRIIKRIQAAKEDQAVEMQDPILLDELETRELSRIELWRRGIAEVEAGSKGTTVDGEFITPGARGRLVDEGVLEAGVKEGKKEKVDKEGRPKVHRAKSSKSTGSVRSKKEGGSGSGKKKRDKEPSLLRGLFRAHTMH